MKTVFLAALINYNFHNDAYQQVILAYLFSYASTKVMFLKFKLFYQLLLLIIFTLLKFLF